MPGLVMGSRVRKSPYYDATVAAGVTDFTVYNHMYMPISYGDPEAEYRRLTEGVAIWDVAGERQVEISGPDAAELTQYLSARSIHGLVPGRARYAPICDHDGNLLNDPVILCLAPDRFWLSIADSDLLLWARAIGRERGADASVFEPDVSPLAIQGPLAEALAGDLFGADVVSGLGFFHHTSVVLHGIPLVLCRSGWSKQGGFELFLEDGRRGGELWSLVWTAGERYGIGPGAPNQTERLESGLLSYGSDTDTTTDPFEAGLGAFVSLDVDHDFIGKAALTRRLGSNHRRRLVNVSIDGSPPSSEHPWPAFLGGRPAGELRSTTCSRRLGQHIGVALVCESAAAPGTELTVVSPVGRHRARVSEVPFGGVL